MTPAAVEDLLRELAPQVLGALARRYSDLAEAEDAVQEALLAAATQWEADGLPESPRGWLIAVAARRMSDRVRANEARRRREVVAASREPSDGLRVPDRDDSLLLLFLCCHPALTPTSAIPLTLRAVGGLTTAEIARAFLVPEATMAQRISRAKQRLKASGARFEMPTGTRFGERLRSVLHVLYLIFSEGYAASTGKGRAQRAVSRGNPPDADGPCVAAGRPGGRGAARLDAAQRGAPPCADGRGRRAGVAQRAGPLAVGPGADRRGRGARVRGAAEGRGRRVSVAGRNRGRARRGGERREDRLATDPRPLRVAGTDDRQPDGDVEPRGRRRDGRDVDRE